ncbi:MAG: hypothetical protein JWP63_3120, partial [Candidatus Solibacter sp.]|nr:hypothetical protein [Candidatus Solibacter sp.]
SPSFCVKMELLKGEAQYWDPHAGGRTSLAAAWSYEAPSPAPGRVDACFVGEERVRPKEGDFYDGWNTSNLIGPFKGGPGTRGW